MIGNFLFMIYIKYQIFYGKKLWTKKKAKEDLKRPAIVSAAYETIQKYGGAAGVFATASTGTAIASLSGAAATNATLAFFGGGSLAAGGLGIAGGTAVLGGLVAGPALAVIGFVVGSKASANLDNAYSNLSKAEEFKEEMNTASSLCIGIRKRTAMFNRFLLSLNSIFEPLTYEMKK